MRSLRMLRLMTGLIAIIAALAVAGIGGLAWRLTQGPFDVTNFARIAVARFAPALSLDRVAVAIAGRDLRIEVEGLRAEGADIAQAEATLEMRPLLRGNLRPRTFNASGFHVQAARGSDGRVSVKGIPGSFLLVEPDRPPGLPDHAGDSTYPTILGGLTSIVIHDATLIFDDVASRKTGALSALDIDLRRDPAGALTGHVHGQASTGDTVASLSVDATRVAGEGPIAVHASIGAVNPAVLAHLDPTFAPLATLDAPVSVVGDVILSPGFDLKHATLHAESSGGQLFLPKNGGGTAPANFAAMVLDADGDAHSIMIRGLRIVLAPSKAPTTTVMITGEASRTADHAVASLHETLDRGQIADLAAIWPVGVGGNARPWLVDNVVAGSVHDGAFDAKLQSGPALDDITLISASGAMQAEAVTLYWLRPIPPITAPHVVLTLVNADTLTIGAPVARQGNISARQVSMRIQGMSVKDQVSQIDADITAPVADVFTLLQAPRLKLLSVHPIPINNPTGQSVTHLTVNLPLESKLSMESVDIHAALRLTDVRIPRLIAGRPLEAGMFALDVTMQGLVLNGNARVAGMPAVIGIGMDFRDGRPSQIVEHGTLSLQADNEALRAAGLDTFGLVTGQVTATLDYAEQRDGHATLQANGNLRDAALATPLGWSKAAGLPATVEAHADLNHGHLVEFEGIRADGPGLVVRGRGELIDGQPSLLHVEQCVIGKTSLSGTIGFPARPGDPMRVTLSGPQLDIAGLFGRKATFDPGTPDARAPGKPYRLDLHFGRVLVSEKGEGMGPVALSAAGDDRRIGQAHLVSSGPEQLDIRIEPHGEGRHIAMSIGDLGLTLRRLGAGLDVDQGAVALSGDFDDRRAGSPLAATLTVDRFGVRRPSFAGKVLQGMTLYGVVDALRGPGLVFDQLTMPFSLVDSMLDIHEAHASSSSLGVTATGRVDLKRGVVDLTGTIVPAYFFNTLPGRVPLIGRLFSPEAGGGVFAATYALRGPVSDPAISVNPLAALTPGAMRGLFGLFN